MAVENSLRPRLTRLTIKSVVLSLRFFQAGRCFLSLPSMMEPDLGRVSLRQYKIGQDAQRKLTLTSVASIPR